jgi:hypothetical protein
MDNPALPDYKKISKILKATMWGYLDFFINSYFDKGKR